jgi:hypothetical protein
MYVPGQLADELNTAVYVLFAWPEELGGHTPDPCPRPTFLCCDDVLSPGELPTGRMSR